MSSLPLRLDHARRILLIKPSALGDVVHALPVAATLHRRYPNAALDWLVEEESADIVRGHPAVAEVVVSGRRRWVRQLRDPGRIPGVLREMRSFAAGLRSRGYDAALDLQGLLKSALYVLATRAPIRVGFAEGREGSPLVLTHRVVAPPQPVHAVDRYLALAAAVGAGEIVRQFQIAIPPEDRAAARSHLAACPRPCVVLHPAARWVTKLWEVGRWRSLAASLLAQGLGVVLTGSREDEALSAAIATGLNPSPILLAGRLSLKQLAAILGEVELMISVDSGPMHLAVAMGTPVVALFGPTDPLRTGPLGAALVLRRPLACSPCLRRRCEIADTHRCMRELSVEEVLAGAQRMVASPLARQDAGRGPLVAGERPGT